MSDCATITLPTWEIHEGQTSPTLGIIWPVDAGYLDGTAYTTWLVEVARAGSTLKLWDTNDVVSAVGTATVPSIVITWAAADLGSLGRGDYVLELTGTAGTAVIKAQLALRVRPQIA